MSLPTPLTIPSVFRESPWLRWPLAMLPDPAWPSWRRGTWGDRRSPLTVERIRHDWRWRRGTWERG